MPIPDFQTALLPLLKYAATQDEVPMKKACIEMGKVFEVTPEEFQENLPSGRAKLFYNRIAWAKQYLLYAGLIEPVRRGVFRITDLGRKWAQEKRDGLKISDFKTIPGYEERVHGKSSLDDKESNPAIDTDRSETPEEQIQSAYKQIQQRIVADLLERIHQKPPEFFETLVLDLMAGLGYGDGTKDSLIHTGKTGDGGVDGKIKMDYLGIEHVFLQAKRYDPDKTVSREQVAAFAGSIKGKGVFLTTARFSPAAIEFVRDRQKDIVLIDGQRLGELMLKAKLGVSIRETLSMYAVDEDYFKDDE